MHSILTHHHQPVQMFFFLNARTYSIFSGVINQKWKCICSCHRGIAARRCSIWQNPIYKHAHVIAFSLFFFFFYDRIIKLWCILEASLLIAGSSYSHSFQRTFQEHDTSMASISLSMKRSRSLLCMAEQNASHINTSSTILNSPSATIHRLNFDRPTCLRHRRVVGSHYHHTYRDTSKIWGCTLDQTSQMHMKCGAQRITEMTAWVLCDKKIIPIGEVRHSLHNLHFHQLSL